jgi:hypothetical protein
VDDVLVLLAKGLVGGSFVVAFALLAECTKPKSFSGLFSAAPSIALAGLLLTVLAKGTPAAVEQSFAMIFATAALLSYCAVAVFGVDRFGALRGSVVAFGSWVAVAGVLFIVVA